MKIYYHIDLENIKYIMIINETSINLPKVFIPTFTINDYYLFDKFKDLLKENFENYLLVPNPVNEERRKNLCDDYLIKYCKDNFNLLNNNTNVLISHDIKLQKRFKEVLRDGIILNTPKNNFITTDGIRYGSKAILYRT